MFDFKKFTSEYQIQVEAINFKVTDLRTGEKQIGCFFYPKIDCKSLEKLSKYGYEVEEIGENTKATGWINLGELFAKFVEEGGLE